MKNISYLSIHFWMYEIFTFRFNCHCEHMPIFFYSYIALEIASQIPTNLHEKSGKCRVNLFEQRFIHGFWLTIWFVNQIWHKFIWTLLKSLFFRFYSIKIFEKKMSLLFETPFSFRSYFGTWLRLWGIGSKLSIYPTYVLHM